MKGGGESEKIERVKDRGKKEEEQEPMDSRKGGLDLPVALVSGCPMIWRLPLQSPPWASSLYC